MTAAREDCCGKTGIAGKIVMPGQPFNMQAFDAPVFLSDGDVDPVP